MSVSSRPSPALSLFSPDDSTLACDWYKIRDLFFGRNVVDQDITRALQLSAACQHPDAVYLTKIFDEKDVRTKEEAKEVFLAQAGNDARALCFSEVVMSDFYGAWDMQRVRRSAELGFAFAQARMAEETDREEMFRHALVSAAQCERDGLYLLGYCFQMGIGCEQNIDKAKENFLVAAELGDILGMTQLGCLLDETDSQQWMWWGRAAQKGAAGIFFSSFPAAVRAFKSDSSSAVCVFEIGRALNGRVEVDSRKIFGKSLGFDDRIGLANEAIAFYKSQLASYRRAVDIWTLVGIRFGVVKDIRIFIGKIIWEWRDLAEYKIDLHIESL